MDMQITGSTGLPVPIREAGVSQAREAESLTPDTFIASKEESGSPALGKTAPRPEGKPATGGTYTGDITIFENFHSDILGNDRNIYVYLPPGYHENKDRQYPVLYMQDGQNVFNRETSFGGVEWSADETAEKLIRQGKMKEVIIVAISNTADRMSEYTHVKDPQHGGGNVESYASFLTRELKPFIDSKYSTSRAPEETAIAGSSLGGLSALYLGWNFSNTFGIVGALSPSIWWAGKDIIGRIEGDPKEKGPSKIWIDAGTRESGQDDNHNGICDHVENAREMGNVLLNKGYEFGKELFYYEDPGATHSEWFWGNRLEKVFLALFGK
jgi:predicted alpha/beta superfamily hydrolase